MIEFEIRSAVTSNEAWLAEWQHRADDAFSGEPETTAYAAALNCDHPNQVVVFERYRHGESSIALHRDRPAHRHLHATMGEQNMTRRRVLTSRFCDVPSVGWWQRDTARCDSLTGAIINFVGLRFDTDADRDAFLAVTAAHAEYCLEAEPGTLAYGAGIVEADADRELDQRAGDLAFVAIYTDTAAMQQHADDPEHVARQAELAAQGVRIEPTFRRSYETTGNGFLWRTSGSSGDA